jgi:hypothetical protein
MIPGHLDTNYLRDQAFLIRDAFLVAGYDIGQGPFPRCLPEFPPIVPGSSVKLFFHATFEAGGMRDVVIELIILHAARI